MFLHANWIHLLGNMWIFWVFGNNIEDRFGHFFFLIFYLMGGLVAGDAASDFLGTEATHWEALKEVLEEEDVPHEVISIPAPPR